MPEHGTQRAAMTRLLHTIHATRDYGALRQAYLNFMGGLAFAESYHAGEDRDMALIYVADHMVEPMAPRRPKITDTTFSRYLSKYGPGWHSLAFGTADAAEASARVRSAGCRLTTDYPGPPGFFFVHPESTGGILVEVTDYRMTNDPYDEPSWNPAWAAARHGQPRRLMDIIAVVHDLAHATRFFTQVLDGRVTEQGRRNWPQTAAAVRIAIGDGHLLLLSPDAAASGPLSEALGRPFSGIYALSWEVEDLAAAAALAAEHGVLTSEAPFGLEMLVDGARHWLSRA